jgi:hypothetical protein
MRLKPWRRFDNRAFLTMACVVVLLSSACGGCVPATEISPADVDRANVIAHGRVIAAVPGASGIDETFQVENLWKGTNFPNLVTYQVHPCEPATDGVLVLTKDQADMARATGHIDGNIRAFTTWSVLDAEPLSFRLTHDLRVWFVIAALAVLIAVMAGLTVLAAVFIKSRRRA